MPLFTSIVLSISLLFSLVYFLTLTRFNFSNKEYLPATFYSSLAVLSGLAVFLNIKNDIKETLPLWAVLVIFVILFLLLNQSLTTLKTYVKGIEKQIINAKKDVSNSQKRIIELEKRLAEIINNLDKEV